MPPKTNMNFNLTLLNFLYNSLLNINSEYTSFGFLEFLYLSKLYRSFVIYDREGPHIWLVVYCSGREKDTWCALFDSTVILVIYLWLNKRKRNNVILPLQCYCVLYSKPLRGSHDDNNMYMWDKKFLRPVGILVCCLVSLYI